MSWRVGWSNGGIKGANDINMEVFVSKSDQRRDFWHKIQGPWLLG